MRHTSLETAGHSPYTKLRLGRVEKTYFDVNKGLGEPSEQSIPADTFLGCVQVQWLDAEGGRDFVKIGFPFFSNPVADTGVGFAYGDISLPSPNDLVLILFRNATNPVIVGYSPINYNQQTLPTSSGKDTSFGTFRRIIPGEMSRQSKQQAEIYQDQAGAVQIIVKAQPVKTSVSTTQNTDGSKTTKVSDIDPGTVPDTEIARIVVGETYQDDTFSNREKGAVSSQPVIVQIRTTAGAKISIDVNGNIEVAAKTGSSISLNDSGVSIKKGDAAGAGITIGGNDYHLVYARGSEINSFESLGVASNVSVGA